MGTQKRSAYFHGYPNTNIKIILVVIKLGHHKYLHKVLLNFIILPSIAVCMFHQYDVLNSNRGFRRKKIVIEMMKMTVRW